MPSLFENPVPPDALNPGSNYDLGAWFVTNGPAVTEPVIRKVLAALKASGVKKVGVTGYCYGARTAFNLAFENEVDVVVVAHPSLLQVPDDITVCTYRASCRPCVSDLSRIEISGYIQDPTAHQQLRG